MDTLQSNDVVRRGQPGLVEGRDRPLDRGDRGRAALLTSHGARSLSHYAALKRVSPPSERLGLDGRSRSAAKRAFEIDPHEPRATGALLVIEPLVSSLARRRTKRIASALQGGAAIASAALRPRRNARAASGDAGKLRKPRPGSIENRSSSREPTSALWFIFGPRAICRRADAGAGHGGSTLAAASASVAKPRCLSDVQRPRQRGAQLLHDPDTTPSERLRRTASRQCRLRQKRSRAKLGARDAIEGNLAYLKANPPGLASGPRLCRASEISATAFANTRRLLFW